MTDYIDLLAIANRLRELQERTGLSNKEFCKRCDIPESSYSQVINKTKRPNVEMINKVIQYMDEKICPPMWLLFGHDGTTTAPGDSAGLFDTPGHGSTPSTTPPPEVYVRMANEINDLKAQLAAQEPKQIERIMVVYTDSTFEVYQLAPKGNAL